MPSTETIQSSINEVFHTRRLLAVLSTLRHGRPHTSLLAVAPTADLKTILFLTRRDTHKYDDMATDPRVALLADNRTEASDLDHSIAVTAVGTAAEVTGPEHEEMLRLFLERNAYLREFAESPAVVLMRVSVERYIVVRGIGEVMEWVVE